MAALPIVRIIFTIVERAPDWVVEQAGADLDTFKTREEATASATRRAHASHNAGLPAQIRFAGEPNLTRA